MCNHKIKGNQKTNRFRAHDITVGEPNLNISIPPPRFVSSHHSDGEDDALFSPCCSVALGEEDYWSGEEQFAGFSTTANAHKVFDKRHERQSASSKDQTQNDYSGGCKRKTQLQCANLSATNQAADRFLEYTNVGLPKDSQVLAIGNVSECASYCSRNCNCTAYAYDGKDCSIWTGDLVNLVQKESTDGYGKTLYLKLAASEFPSGKSKKVVITGAVAGSVGAVLLLGLVFMIIWKRQRRATTKPAEGSLIAFAYRDLQSASKNFSEKLGGGSFGSVFKGTLSDSTVIAVKKLESISQGEKQFRTEVSTIGTIQHVVHFLHNANMQLDRLRLVNRSPEQKSS